MNHYEILGVGPDATELQIKEAYRREAMKWHPDRHDGAAAKGEADRRFKDLAVAYRTLRNPVDRANYDRQLEQKLRQEYEARQKEQARQQRAHNEQAQQRQTRQEPPQPDFADTGPQFEEQTASNDDANQMFYEQMLDLAFELAGRGFPEFNIFKALVALGCPGPLAKAVAATAAKQGLGKGTNDGDDKREAPPLSNFDDASFEEMEPYYIAAIMGSEPLKPISNERYDAILAMRKRRGKFWLTIGLLLLVAGGLTAYFQKNGTLFTIAVGSELLILFLWVLSRNLFLGQDQARFRAEAIKRYYLDCFRPLHQGKLGSTSQAHKTSRSAGFRYPGLNAGAFVAAFGWLGYRRLPILAFVWASIYAAIGYAIALAESSSNFKWPGGASMGFAAGFAVYANRLYFNKIRSNILNAMDQSTQSQALTQLRKVGGTNHFGWILPWVYFVLLLIPLGILIEEDQAAKTRTAQEQQAAQVAADQAASETRQRSADQQAHAQVKAEYDRTLTAIEARYPQLNPDSPQYNQAAMAWVVERKKVYDQGGGRSPAISLQQAVTDYAAELQRSQASLSNVQTEATYISYLKSLSRQDRNYQAIADMGVKFPKLNGYLSYTKVEFRAEHAALANLVENSQTWGFNRNRGPQGGFIVFQNRTNQQLKGITVEIQAEERSCDQKGNVYYMTLEFDRSVAPASVVGVDFQFPTAIPNANRCLDIVDLTFG